MSNSAILSNSKKKISQEEKILKEIYEEISHHDIFSFKLDNESLNNILSKIKPFDKKFFHYQRYNFKLQDISPDLCSFYDIEYEKEKDKNNNIINNFNEIRDENLIDEEGKRKKINDILSDHNVKISEVLENIMEDVNIFDKIYQEEQNKIENENIKIEVSSDINKKELKYLYFHQSKENEKLKNAKPISETERIYPIEIINKIENDYNNESIEKIKNETKNTDLYPLDTYKKNHELEVQLLLENLKDLQFQSLKEKILIKEKTNMVEEKDIFSVLTIDKPNQEPGSIEPRYMYVGTNMGKIIKMLLNNRKAQNNNESIREIFDSKEDGVNCIDIFENYMVTGHQNGSIVYWEDNKIFDKTQNIYQNQNQKKNIEIIYLKIIKIIPRKKLEIIYSDKMGKVYYLRRIKGLIKYSESKELLFNEVGNLTYKILFFSVENDLKKTKKKMMLFALTSTKGINFLQIRPKMETKDENQNKYIIKTISSPTGKLDNGIFDTTFGFGFPPMQDKLHKNSVKGSVSDSIVIGKDKSENILFAISFEEIINLYEVNYTKVNKLYNFNIKCIGHFINDKHIINVSFLTNSYISIITNDYFLKIINTFDFDKNEFKNKHEPTKNSLLTYEPIELKKLIMMRQTNIFRYNETDKKFNSYYIYLNSVITLNKSIIILGRQNLYQYTLLQWDAIIQSLDRAKEYEKMLWLTMVVFNNNKNLLTIQSRNKNEEFLKDNKYQICSPIIYKFLIQVVMLEIEKNNNFIPIRMLIEFCIGAELYDCLYEAVIPLSQKGYDCHLYRNLTKYILNDDCQNFIFKPTFLLGYIKYYADMHEKNILSEVLFHINISSIIEQKLIMSAVEEFKLINITLYSQIKNVKAEQFDHFKPIKYLYDCFKKDFYKDKDNKLFETESDKTIKENYNKLIIENDNKYYNDDMPTYYEYLGHKILWYCNKCLSGEEFHSNIKFSNQKTAKKIIIFLTIKEIMKEFLEFDSYSYFQVISRFFLETELFKLIHREIESNEDLFNDIKDFVETYLGEKKVQTYFLTDKYFFYEIQEVAESFKNIFIRYDYYKFVSMICAKNSEFRLDRVSLKNAIRFFINYTHDLKRSDFPDTFNCHKKPRNIEELKEQLEEIEIEILLMINSFQNNNELTKEDIEEILEIENISLFRKTRIYLYEASNHFEESFQLHKDELEEENPNIPKNEKIISFFQWINLTLQNTYHMEQSKIPDNEIYHQRFKEFILSNFNYLSNLSLKELSNLVDNWYKGQEEKIVSKLNDSESQSLKFKYIIYYLGTHENNYNQNDENNTYYKFLLMKIDLLIKANNKEQVLSVLHHNSYLCKSSLLNNLLKHEVYDACIYIYHILGELDEGIELAKNQIKIILNELLEEISSKKYLSTNIENKLIEYKKYIELGLGICQRCKITRKTEIDLVNDYWLILINAIYSFQIGFEPEFNKNRNNYKTADYIKINDTLTETFELVLSKMSDYISLPLILDIMSEKCGEAGFTKFKELNYLMFFNFRLRENMYKYMKNSIESRVNLEINNYLYERNKGHFSNFYKCAECQEFLGSSNIDKIIYFSCNHIYHKICFIKNREKGKECYICKKLKKNDNDCFGDKNDNNNYFKIIDEVKENENIEKMKKKEEEFNKVKKRREKMIQLRRINKKKREINNVLINNLP